MFLCVANLPQHELGPCHFAVGSVLPFVFFVLLLRNPGQIKQAVVPFAPIQMGRLVSVWSRPNESTQHEAMNQTPLLVENHAKVGIARLSYSPRWRLFHDTRNQTPWPASSTISCPRPYVSHVGHFIHGCERNRLPMH